MPAGANPLASSVIGYWNARIVTLQGRPSRSEALNSLRVPAKGPSPLLVLMVCASLA